MKIYNQMYLSFLVCLVLFRYINGFSSTQISSQLTLLSFAIITCRSIITDFQFYVSFLTFTKDFHDACLFPHQLILLSFLPEYFASCVLIEILIFLKVQVTIITFMISTTRKDSSLLLHLYFSDKDT